MSLVSIVVPIYKVEKFLDRCILSLIGQTLEDIEIIMVDDGSPDDCPNICNQWAQLDNRIKVVHKTNGGLSSARNAGLRVATGKYVGFVDSDDDVELDMYERMLTIAEKYNVDFVMADYYRIGMDGTKYLKSLDIDGGYHSKAKIKSDIFTNLIMRECIDYGPLLSVWHCLYDVTFLRKKKIEFDEKVRWSEDNIFSAIMGYQAESFYYMKGDGLYHYYQNIGTITTSYRKGAWQVYCTMNNHLHDFFDGLPDYDFSRQLKLHIIYYACNCIGMEMSQEKEKAIEAIDWILHDDHVIRAFQNFEMPKVSLKFRVQLFLMKYRKVKLLYRLKSNEKTG